jgi:hypothetical protein
MKSLFLLLAFSLCLSSCTNSLDEFKAKQKAFDAMPQRYKDSIAITRSDFSGENNEPVILEHDVKTWLKHPASFRYISSGFHMEQDTAYVIHMDFSCRNTHDSVINAAVDMRCMVGSSNGQFIHSTKGIGFPNDH